MLTKMWSNPSSLFLSQQCTNQYYHLAVFTLVIITSTTCSGQTNLTPTANYVETEISPGQSLQIVVTGSPSGTGYVLVQAHAFLKNVTLSTDAALTPGQFTKGQNVGLVLMPPAASAYVKNDNNETVAVLLIAQFYNVDAPIPGGCNMEESIKTAPFLPTSFTRDILTVEYPLGSWPLNVKPATCDRAPLQYDIYEYYVVERDLTSKTAFDSIRLMSNMTAIERNGKKVTFSGSPPSQVKFANYPGTGRVVAVILRTLTSSAAYTPTLSYGCYTTATTDSSNEDAADEVSCQVLTSVGAKLLTAGLLFVGLFLILLGHRFYKCQLFLLGFCMSAILFYIILERVISVGSTVAGTSSTTVGALGGALWLALWSKFGSPMAPVLLAALLLGSLFASTVAYTPLGDIPILKDDLTFWLAYVCVTLAVPLSIISFAQLTSIIVTSVLGAYFFIIPIDHFIGSNLKYIALNTIRRATNSEFGTAIVDPTFQWKGEC
ncbi:Transmembrane 7 superfamily member 3 [Orchesella cincta]|uniref:Transmembrane 7 superfamily member 3 n=1 Tax=Orchesella cincta TaxID=48709 RepID=A0A1D2N751_ORCCI|nr:Transmembrane 7 superfamily member 3 [Orchesella cincta]